MSNHAVKKEARDLMHSAKVPPLCFTLFYLALRLVLDEIRTALGSISPLTLPSFDAATVQPEELLRAFSSLFIAHTPFQWAVMFLTVFIVLLVWVLSAGYKCYCLGVSRGEMMPYGSLFDGFSFVGKVLGLSFLLGLLVSAGASFFLLPGVLFFFMYRFALHNLCADPSIGILTAMKRSRLQTEGHKMALFSLELSFLPLLILMFAMEYLGSWFLAPLLPYSLSGDLLYALCTSLLSYMVSVFYTPYRELSFALYFTKLTQGENSASASYGN